MASVPKSKTCPICSKQMTLPAGDQLPKAVKCPHCTAILQVQPKLKPIDATNPPPTILPTTSQQKTREANQAGVPQSLSPIGNAAGDDHFDAFPDNNTQQHPLPPHTGRGLTKPELWLFTNPKWFWRLSYLTIWFGPIIFLVLWQFCAVILMSLGHQADTDTRPPTDLAGAMCISVCFVWIWLPVGHWPAKFLSWLLTMAVVREIRCPGCQERCPATDYWNCGCGYHPPHKRKLHILASFCPLCKKSVGWIDCEVCGCTILIR